METGVLVRDDTWGVIEGSLPTPEVDIQWVSMDVAEAVSFVTAHPPQLLIVESHPNYLTPQLVETTDRQGTLLAALITDPSSDQWADERGVGHRIRQPEDIYRLPGLGRQHSLGGQPDPTAVRGHALVRLMWGPHGSPGRTTLSVAMASLLSMAGLRVVVVDADWRGGAVGPSLGLVNEVPGILAAARRVRQGTLDSPELERLLEGYQVGRSHFRVLTGAHRPLERGELTRDDLEQIVAALGTICDVILIDSSAELPESGVGDGPNWAAELTAHLAYRADEIIAVCQASPLGVSRFARALGVLRESAGTTPHRVWLNGVSRDRRALRDEATLREALWRFAGVDEPYIVARDDDGARRAAIAGVSIADISGGSALASSLDRDVEGVVAVVTARRNRLASQHNTDISPTKRETLSLLRRGWEELRGRWHQLTALR